PTMYPHLHPPISSPSSLLFFFNDTPTTEIYTLSLHDALPIYPAPASRLRGVNPTPTKGPWADPDRTADHTPDALAGADRPEPDRSEEHTSELQSRSDLVCRLLLEKKKNTKIKKSYPI